MCAMGEGGLQGADEAELGGVCKGAQGVRCVGVDVVQGGGGEGAACAGGRGAVVGEGVHACNVGGAVIQPGGLVAPFVDEAGGEELAGGVDGGPEVGGDGGADAGVACLA